MAVETFPDAVLFVTPLTLSAPRDHSTVAVPGLVVVAVID
jgi:hypothetical protein